MRLHLDQIDALDQSIRQIERKVEELLVPFGSLLKCLQTMPGIKGVAAAVLLAEVGDDMGKFRRLASGELGRSMPGPG
ncbi:MAG: transposase [Longimicrobiales bacterium]